MEIKEILDEIRKADSVEIDILMDAVFDRKRILYPEWDIQYLALPKKDWVKRRHILENMILLESKIREMFEEKAVDTEQKVL